MLKNKFKRSLENSFGWVSIYELTGLVRIPTNQNSAAVAWGWEMFSPVRTQGFACTSARGRRKDGAPVFSTVISLITQLIPEGSES